MESALKLYGWAGIQKEWVKAIEIKSHADARKLAPFMDEHHAPLAWVNWSNPKSLRKKALPYFRHYPVGKTQKYRTLEEDFEEKKQFGESDIHFTAKTMLAQYLESLIKDGKSLEWGYRDDRISDFTITGNLMSGVEEIQLEYKYKLKLLDGKEYKFDIALLRKNITKTPFILGVIEIEKENKFGLLKCLICKSLGFPLISVDVGALKKEDITIEWAKQALRETTGNSEDGLRRNYIYIHNALYPVFTNIPVQLRLENKHQYVIFCKPIDLEKLTEYLEKYRVKLGLSRDEVHVDKPKLNRDDERSVKMFQNEGSIAGKDWQDYNSEQYIRLTLRVPSNKEGNLYLYHLVIARLLNAHFQTLVGYKYTKGITNKNPENSIWTHSELDRDTNELKKIRILQKQMSEPIQPIIDYLIKCGIFENVLKK